MNDPIITVEHLSKRYRLGQIGASSLRDSAQHLWHRLRGRDPAEHMGKLGKPDKPKNEEQGTKNDEQAFWALRDVSFEVQQGEVLGIIGRNGAGKSTLLKILSRITEPTAGRAVLRGRVASLLEVGTGFHPELTGRENIYLNGAILGMRKAEIARKFDEIVAFSEVEKFIDTPVKRYSSGMYVRLAFAVAAHLDPEIMIVDEVLAVGDASFQKKCLGKMGQVARGGRTVLFVSHNMGAIRQLCSSAIHLDGGGIVTSGGSMDVVDEYVRSMGADDTFPSIGGQIASMPKDPGIEFEDVEVFQVHEGNVHFVTGKATTVRVTYRVLAETLGLRVFVVAYDPQEGPIFRSFCGSDQAELPLMDAGRYISEATIPQDLLAPITYDIGVSAAVHNNRFCLPSPIRKRITVHDAGRIRFAYSSAGCIFKIAPLIPWTTRRLDR